MLFVCTGNICRSPMAEGLMRHRLSALGVDAHVHSAGILGGARPASTNAVEVLGRRGIDLAPHRSRELVRWMIEGSDLVLGMTREHVREAVVLDSSAWPKTFTLKEIVRRAEQRGGRAPDQPFSEWLDKLHAGREQAALLGSDPDDDVADPIGLDAAAYARTADELSSLVDRLVTLGWGG